MPGDPNDTGWDTTWTLLPSRSFKTSVVPGHHSHQGAVIFPRGFSVPPVFGLATVLLPNRIAPIGLNGGYIFGQPSVGAQISPLGVASPRALGGPVLAVGISPSGVASSRAFGQSSVKAVVLPTGALSPKAFGLPVVTANPIIFPVGIPSAQAFGSAAVKAVVSPLGLASPKALGVGSIKVTVSPSGFVSPRGFGTPSVVLGIVGGQNLMGMNLSWNSASDYSQDRIFADAVKNAREWRTIGTNLQIPKASLDANLWPTGDAQLLLMAGLDKHDGLYSGSFTGAGTVAVGTYGATGITGLTQSYNAGTNTTTFSFTIVNGTNAAIELSFTGIAGGVKNLKIMRPVTNGAAQSYAPGTQFTDQIINFLQKFTTIRFMDYSWVNGSRIVNWSDRALITEALWGAAYHNSTYNSTVYSDGAPWEAAIDLGNATNCDIWVNIPFQASDDYVTQLATLILGRLNPGLNVYVEYCNEVWNTAGPFPQSGWNHTQAIADVAANLAPMLNSDGETNDWMWAYRRVGRRAAEVSNLFRAVFGDAAMPAPGRASPRVRPVLAGQLSNDVVLRSGMAWLMANFPNTLNYYFYGLGGSAYWRPVDTSSVNSFFAAGFGTIEAAAFAIDAAMAIGFGLKRIAYEGGPDLPAGTSTQNAIYQAAVADARMTDLLQEVHNTGWSGVGGDMLVYYEATGDFQWGFLTDLFQASSPKVDAINALKLTPKAAPGYLPAVPCTVGGRNETIYHISGNTFNTGTLGAQYNSGAAPKYSSFVLWGFRTTVAGTYNLDVNGNAASAVSFTIDGVAVGTMVGGTTATRRIGSLYLEAGAHVIALLIPPGRGAFVETVAVS